jgi:hypothetical protein
MPNRRRASSKQSSKPFQFQWTLTLTLCALTTLPIANASPFAPATAWSTEFSEIFSADATGLEDIHRVILKMEREFTAIGMGLFLDEATTSYRNKDVSASKDANDAYNASTWMCRQGNALTTSDVVRVRMESLGSGETNHGVRRVVIERVCVGESALRRREFNDDDDNF